MTSCIVCQAVETAAATGRLEDLVRLSELHLDRALGGRLAAELELAATKADLAAAEARVGELEETVGRLNRKVMEYERRTA